MLRRKNRDTEDDPIVRKCPVCGQHKFSEPFEKCPVCNWENDYVQEKNPSWRHGANEMALDDTIAAYNEGRTIHYFAFICAEAQFCSTILVRPALNRYEGLGVGNHSGPLFMFQVEIEKGRRCKATPLKTIRRFSLRIQYTKYIKKCQDFSHRQKCHQPLLANRITDLNYSKQQLLQNW